jgi:phage tail sheath gpL-like
MALTSIPITLVPGAAIQFDPRNAVRGLTGMPRSINVIGQPLASAPIARGFRQLITSNTQAVALAGAGSLLASMLLAALRNAGNLPVYAIALDDDAGSASQWEVQFNIDDPVEGPSIGEFVRYIGATSLNGRVRIAVNADDTGDTLAQSFVDAVNDNPNLNVTAAVDGADTSKAVLTAKWVGATANQITINQGLDLGRNEPDAAGLTVITTQPVISVGNPDISAAFAATEDDHMTKLVSPYLDEANLRTLEAELDRRWQYNSQRDGRAIFAVGNTDTGATAADLIAWANNGRNSHQVAALGIAGSATPHFVIAADVASAIEASANKDPAVAFEGLPLRSTLPPNSNHRFSETERHQLLAAGVSTFNVDAAGLVRIERMVTMYTENEVGALDTAYQDLNTVEVLSFWRWSQNNDIRRELRGFKLAEDGDSFGPEAGPVMTPERMRSWLIGHYQKFVSAGIMENLSHYKDQLIVLRNSEDPNRLDTEQQPNTMNQLRFVGTNAAFVR